MTARQLTILTENISLRMLLIQSLTLTHATIHASHHRRTRVEPAALAFQIPGRFSSSVINRIVTPIMIGRTYNVMIALCSSIVQKYLDSQEEKTEQVYIIR